VAKNYGSSGLGVVSLDHQHAMTAAPAIEIGIFSGMDSGVRWQGFDAQVAVDWLLRTPEQMHPKIQPLNRRKRQSGS
jgi:hypothetical protein